MNRQTARRQSSRSDEAAAGPASRSGAFNWIGLLVLLGVGGLLVALMLPRVERTREVPRRSQCKYNLKQITLALHNYADAYGGLPPACTVDQYGQRLHSWRTLILPYLDQQALYDTIDLTKPWDDPANAAARQARVDVYRCPSTAGPADHTAYLACVGLEACFHPGESRPFSDIADGSSNTLMVIEAPPDRTVPWMSPQDADEALLLSLRPDSKLAHTGGVHAALCDGAIRFLSVNVSPATLRALWSAAAGDKVGEY